MQFISGSVPKQNIAVPNNSCSGHFMLNVMTKNKIKPMSQSNKREEKEKCKFIAAISYFEKN